MSEPSIVAVIVAVVAIVPSTIAAINSTRAKKELKPNSGKSTRDSIDHLTETLKGHVDSTNAWRATVDSRLQSVEDYITSPTPDNHQE